MLAPQDHVVLLDVPMHLTEKPHLHGHDDMNFFHINIPREAMRERCPLCALPVEEHSEQ